MVKTTSKYIRIINGELKVLRLKKSTNSENLFSISQRFAYCKARVLSSISKLFVIRNVGSCRPCSLKITWRTLRLVRGSMTSLSYILNLLNLRFSFFRSTLIQSSSGILFTFSINFLPRLLNVMNLILSTSSFSNISYVCLLYTSDAADDLLCVDLGGRRIIKKKKKK